MRNIIAEEKCTTTEWLDIMKQAHNIGFKSTATMMYGHVETDKEIIEHLLALRALQDRTGGFSAFIPWSFKPGNSPLSKRIRQAAHPMQYLRIISVARVFLDNFDQIQSSWFSESVKMG